MEKQIDICKSCCYSVKNYASVIGNIPYTGSLIDGILSFMAKRESSNNGNQ